MRGIGPTTFEELILRLCDAVASRVEWHAPDKNGVTLAEHTIQIGGEVDDTPPPEDGEYIWAWFWELDRTRPTAMVGTEPIYYREIQAWASLSRITLSPWEVDALVRMDHVYRSEWARRRKT